MTFDISLSKSVDIGKHKMTFGTNIFNIFDAPYAIDVYQLSGKAGYPGDHYDKSVGKAVSGSYYDRPWMYSSNREINFFIRLQFD